MRHLTFCATLFIAVAISGCSGTPRPDGLPKLYPCTITITQEGKPLEGVSVSLYDPAITDRWAVGGQTNASGVATIHTHGQFLGTPAGRFKVVLTKTVTESDSVASDIEWASPKVRGDTRFYSLVGKEYINYETTPLEIVIDGKKRNESFDIGSVERILIQTFRAREM